MIARELNSCSALAMDELQLTETEKRYFEDLFVCCDSDNIGTISVYRASELFRCGNLPIDILKQIVELCGVGHMSHFGRREFYTALKLIGAFQAGLPMCPELVQSGIDIPLPKFTRTTELGKWQHGNQNIPGPDLIHLSDRDRTPTPQKETMTSDCDVEVLRESPQLTVPQNNGSTKAGSPEVSSTASDSPTPTNSVQERNWATTHWQSLAVCEEQRQLLGTEEESSDRHSSEEEDLGDVWVITDEQRDYYTTQFRALQPDPDGLIAGPVARLFFEKSRLPVQELRKIWQLADVSKDGALSQEEFNTAMHLVVLRRNNIELPETLPASLAPQGCVAPSREDQSLPSPSTDPLSPPRNKEWTKFVDSPTSSVSSPGPKPVNFDFQKSAVEQDPKILHPVPLRVTPESQGLPPAEEDVFRSPRKLTEAIPYEKLSSSNATEQESPKKAGTPHLANLESGDIRPIQRPQAKKHTALGPGAIPPPPQPLLLPATDDPPSLQLSGPQSGPTSLPLSVNAPQMGSLPQGPKKEPPPPPPPRPYRSHTRSSSLDLNQLGRCGGLLSALPVVPPRISPSTTSPKKLIGQRSEGDVLSLMCEQPGFADFAHFGQEGDKNEAAHPRKHGAFEVYQKPTKTLCEELEQDTVAEDRDRHQSDPSDALTNRRHMQRSVQQLQEQNNLLNRLCEELSQELADVQEERVSLEVQLEQLRNLQD